MSSRMGAGDDERQKKQVAHRMIAHSLHRKKRLKLSKKDRITPLKGTIQSPDS
jgi:hypothetical protein